MSETLQYIPENKKNNEVDESNKIYIENQVIEIIDSFLSKNISEEQKKNSFNELSKLLNSEKNEIFEKAMNEMNHQVYTNRKLPIEIIEFYQNYLKENINSTDRKKVVSVLNALKGFTTENLDSTTIEDKKIIKKSRELLFKGLEQDNTYNYTINLLTSLLRDSEEERKWILELLDKNLPIIENEFLENNNIDLRFKNTFDLFEIASKKVGSEGLQIRNKIFNIIKKYISKFNINGNDVFDAWRESFEDGIFDKKYLKHVSDIGEFYYKVIYPNLKNMMELKNKYPDSVKVLNNQFGICDFGRYPLEMLEKQYENLDKDNKPFGLIIFPRYDNNGAFYEYINKLLKLHNDLDDNYHIIIFECEDKIDICNSFRKIRNKFKKHKISFMILGGHGTEESIKFGNGIEKDRLKIKDFKLDKNELLNNGQKSNEYDKRLTNKSSFFEQGATIILASCSTGAKNGIAQELSKALNIKVIGPENPTSLDSIDVNIDDNKKLDLSVNYHDGNKKSVYLSGNNYSR